MTATRHALYQRMRELPATVHVGDTRQLASLAFGFGHWTACLGLQLTDAQLEPVAAAIAEPGARLLVTVEPDHIAADIGAQHVGTWPLVATRPLFIVTSADVDDLDEDDEPIPPKRSKRSKA